LSWDQGSSQGSGRTRRGAWGGEWLLGSAEEAEEREREVGEEWEEGAKFL
jgi:hypothetical protein